MLLNFGGTSYSETQSPGHAVGGVTGTTWNSVAADTASGIVDQNGSATNLALNFGTATTIANGNYANATRAADYTLGSSNPGLAGTLFDTPLGKGNAVRDLSAQGPGIILNLTGLVAGEYDFYLTTFRGDHNDNLVQVYPIYAGAAANPITDFTGLQVGSLNNSSISTAGGWIEGTNYLHGTFTIDGVNDNFSLLVSTSSSYLGVLTSLEVVAIPEPSYFLGLGMVFAMTVLLRKRLRA